MPYVNKDQVQTKELEPKVFARIMIDRSRGSQGIALVRGRIAPGGVLPWHAHDVEEALTVLQGAGLSEIGQEKYNVAAGDAVLLPARMPHQLSNVGEDDLLFVTAFSGNEVVRLPV